jgi:hypothetical protein
MNGNRTDEDLRNLAEKDSTFYQDTRLRLEGKFDVNPEELRSFIRLTNLAYYHTQ